MQVKINGWNDSKEGERPKECSQEARAKQTGGSDLITIESKQLCNTIKI